MKKKPSPLFPIVVALAGTAVLASVVIYIKDSPGKSVPPEQHKLADTQPPGLKTPDKVTVYKPRYDGDKLVFDKSQAKAAPKEDPKVFALNEFLKGLPMVPKGARAKSVKVANGVATVDFTTEFETFYGTEDEQTVLKGILTTLGQFEDVDKAVFTVEGKPLESIGNVDLGEPQQVMRPGQTVPESGDAASAS
ncbi:MAG: GerMN domain-containing protein [Fimbriimonadaceae bacterium]|nr:GerMN domain-containing protein [Fimbriimonadaceae bacterium]